MRIETFDFQSHLLFVQLSFHLYFVTKDGGSTS